MKDYIYDLAYAKKQSEKELFKVVSTFAGGGGSSTGYRLAGGKVLGINEFVPAAQEVYHANWPETHIFKQDIRELTGDMILEKLGLKKGELDIFDGSPPCSSFSAAGLRDKGWGREKKYSDTAQVTDDLFFEFARLLKEIQPKVFIAENVKGIVQGAAAGLLGTNQMGMFDEHKDTIYHTLTDCGYKVRFKVLNAADYGVPQARERTIFIGVRNDIDIEITYPVTNTKHVSVFEAIDDIVPDEWRKLSKTQADLYPKQKQGESMYQCGQRLDIKMSGMTRIRSHRDKPSSTVTTKMELWHYDEPRTLAINELRAISSFPTDYYLGDTIAKRWERMGRAVPPLMMKAIAEHVYKTILSKI